VRVADPVPSGGAGRKGHLPLAMPGGVSSKVTEKLPRIACQHRAPREASAADQVGLPLFVALPKMAAVVTWVDSGLDLEAVEFPRDDLLCSELAWVSHRILYISFHGEMNSGQPLVIHHPKSSLRLPNPSVSPVLYNACRCGGRCHLALLKSSH